MLSMLLHERVIGQIFKVLSLPIILEFGFQDRSPLEITFPLQQCPIQCKDLRNALRYATPSDDGGDGRSVL